MRDAWTDWRPTVSDGEALTARFYEAVGREVEQGERGQWFEWQSSSLGRDVRPVPDYTQPGHLETVIGMVRERCETPESDWPTMEDWQAFNILWADHPATEMMKWAIRAAGMEVPE